MNPISNAVKNIGAGDLQLACLLFALWTPVLAGGDVPPAYERVVERTFESVKRYADPLAVEVDVVFNRAGQTWRVPAFWSGDSRWTVRFAPASPGDYVYRLESTDRRNPDLNGHKGRVTVTAYTGSNPLLKHGMPRVSANGHYFEHADGTPYFWMGETLWTGLSDRLPWEGFKTLTRDLAAKGFTTVQICGGLVPSNEEDAPSDAGFCNEGGCAWMPDFTQINPRYFDYADRRIQYLIEQGIAPAIVGGWRQVLPRMGANKFKRHWRYLIARYGAYPVFWVAGGEVYDPAPSGVHHKPDPLLESVKVAGWTEIVRYIRDLDPYHHPLAVHEATDDSLQDNSLTDFEIAQAGSTLGPATLGYEVAMANMRYARTTVSKPVVIGEVAIEQLGNTFYQDSQRAAFWLGMLNGATGVTHAAAPTYESNNPDKPLHRRAQFTFLSWEEGMHFPGSYQMGIAAKLLRRYRWWQFAPHPEWVTPRGTTLLEPQSESYALNQSQLAGFGALSKATGDGEDSYWKFWRAPDLAFPGGRWQQKGGNFRAPYAAGIPREVRIIYAPYAGLPVPSPPTVLQLEPGVRYHSYLWEPSLGIPFDLGDIELPAAGPILFEDTFDSASQRNWIQSGDGALANNKIRLLKSADPTDAQVSLDMHRDAEVSILLRYRGSDNYVAATYSPEKRAIYLTKITHGKTSSPLGATTVESENPEFRLSAEIRGKVAIVQLNDGQRTYSSPIEDLPDDGDEVGTDANPASPGAVGLAYQTQQPPFSHFVLRGSPKLQSDAHLNRSLVDAAGRHRGELSGPGWDDFGKTKLVLLNAYRPERFPSSQDWILVLEHDDTPRVE